LGKQLRVNQAATFLGISKSTLRHYADEGVVPCTTLPSGHRYFDEDDLNRFLNKESFIKNKEDKKKLAYIYARVSTKKQADSGNLDRQITRLVEYSIKNGYEIVQIYKEVASGINENRRELHKLLTELKENSGAILLVEYKDRLARFGFRYIERYIHDFDCSIEIIENVEKDDEKELVEDLIAITTSFSARIYGKRGGKKVEDQIESILKHTEKED
jgi:putative resolvase